MEKLFGEAKEQMGLRRARRRGYRQVTEQCLMTATVQNIKRIIRAIRSVPDEIATIQAPVVDPAGAFITAFTIRIVQFLESMRSLRLAPQHA